MAFLGFKASDEAADLFERIVVPGNREPKHRYHITLLYLGSDVPIDDVARAALVAYGITRNAQPITVLSRLVTSFPEGDDGVPIIARIESPGLHAFQTRVRTAFDEEGIEYSKRFPEYKPHVTLAYSDAGTNMPDQSIPPIVWTLSELVLWGGDEGEDRIVVTLPLESDFDVAAALRVASRHQRGHAS